MRRITNAPLIAFGVEIVWDNRSINKLMSGFWDACLASPADCAGADDIITNLAKEKKPEIEITERTPLRVTMEG